MGKFKVPQKLRRTLSGGLAVVLAATAVGPLFSVISSASTSSFDYIEELKGYLNGGCYNIMEIAPEAKQTAMGYLADGNEPLDLYPRSAATVEGWKKADRASYMSNVYTDLSNKGIIGSTVNNPLLLSTGGGYKEYFPWEVTNISEGKYYYNGDLETVNGQLVPKAGAKQLTELEVVSTDSDTVNGEFVQAPNQGGGDYKLNANYEVSKKLFSYKAFSSKYDKGTFHILDNRLVNYRAGDNLSFNNDNSSITVKSGSNHLTALTLPLTTVYNSWEGFLMEVEKNKEYELSFDVNVTGGDFYVGIFESATSGLVTVTNPTPRWQSNSSDSGVNPSQSTTTAPYKITFKTGNSSDYVNQKVYVQISFGVNSKNTTATFSNIYLGEPRGFVQHSDRFFYADENYTDTDNDFWYSPVFTPISAEEWDTRDFDGVAIYEKDTADDGKEIYTCIGVAGVDEMFDIDYDKAIAGEYYTAVINEDVTKTNSDGTVVGLQTVTAQRDEYHTYRAEALFESGTSNLSFKPSAGGYFKALDKTYSFTEDNGDYVFTPAAGGSASIGVYTNVVYYANYVTNNDLFKYKVLDYDDEKDNFSVAVTCASPEEILATDASKEYYNSRFNAANLIVISAGTGTVADPRIDKAVFTADISQEIKDSVLEAVSGSKKTPVIVDSRLISSSFANAVPQETCPVLYSLIDELISRNCENYNNVSINAGGVSENVYAFNPAHTASTVASIATDKFNSAITQGQSGSEYRPASPYYDVWYQIHYENRVRASRVNVEPLSNQVVSEATCIRCIINCVGRRIMSDKENIRVLDIEPYTNKPSISEMTVLGWLPADYFKGDDGLPAVVDEGNVTDFITLKCMSTAELNGVGDLIIENYDLVYVGASHENLHTQIKNGVTYVDYNDESDYMKDKLYTGIGDTHTVGNINYDSTKFTQIVSGAVEGNTLAGLLNVDYNAITGSIWYVAPGYEFGLRTTGNDITRDVMNQLKEFADSGFPVVFADDLVVGKADEQYTITVDVDAMTCYRATKYLGNKPNGIETGTYTHFNEYNSGAWYELGIGDNQNTEKAKSGTDAVYYTFMKATLNGDIPKGVEPVFTWYYKNRSTGAIGLMDLHEEPISLTEVTTADGNASNWYATVGDWDYLGNLHDNNNDGIYSGLAMPGGQSYQKTIGEYSYFCEVTFKKGATASLTPTTEKVFITDQLTCRSNDISYTSSTQSFNMTGTRDKNGVMDVTIEPNPFYYNVCVYKREYEHSGSWPWIYSSCGDDNTLVTNTASKLVVRNTCDKSRMQVKMYINCNEDKDAHIEGWNSKNDSFGTKTSTVRIVSRVKIGSPKTFDKNHATLANNTVMVDNSKYKQASEFSVDNTSFMYQFISDVYNFVDYSEAEEATGKVDKPTYPNAFMVSDFPTRASDLRDCLIDETPTIAISDRTLVSYPDPLPDRNLSFNFVVYSDKDSNGSDYVVKLFIDTDHDAVFSDSEETSITYMKAKGRGKAPTTDSNGRYVVKSSTSTGGTYNEYNLQKTLPSTYVGVIPWKIIVTDRSNSYFHDSYIGYAYRQAAPGEGTIINAVQVLPADHWSNTARIYRNKVGQIIQDYTNNNPTVRGMWRPTYNTSGINVSQAPFDSATTAAAQEGNAYLGSLFLGTGAGRSGSIYENDQAWYYRDKTMTQSHDLDTHGVPTNLIYTYTAGDYKNDAFYQLCIDENSILDRTVYYEDANDVSVDPNDHSELANKARELLDEMSQYHKINYRTHVELWVNPKGPKVAKTKPNGEVVTDYFGNVVYGYEQFDFELDISLTDIYEMNFCWYTSEQAAESNAFLSQFDMLILGFGDSYGKTARQNRAGLELAASNLGFNLYAAKAIRNYIDSGKPVLFCHDTTNGNVNCINYFGLEAMSWIANIADKIQTFWNTTVKEVATKVWYWIRNVVRTYITHKPTLEVPSPDITQEDELNSRIADSRTRDGYYNNLILRAPLKLDRYGITYEICKQMDQKEGGQTYWQKENFRAGHKFNYLLGNTYVSAEYPVQGSTTKGVITEPEMLGHGFVVAYEPGSAKKTTLNARGDSSVNFTTYNNAAAGTKMIDGQSVNITFTGKQVKGDYIYDTQGFTKWIIARYLSNNIDKQSDKYMPATVPGNITDKHRGPYYTTAITQTNKGSLTTYPYDVNTSKFGGTIGNPADGKITIMPTHDQVYQTNLNDGDTTVWYCLADRSGIGESEKVYDILPNDGVNSYYIYTSGNVTYTGAGHANIFSEEEAKLFINTLVAAYRVSKEKPVVHFRDETDTKNLAYEVITTSQRAAISSEDAVEVYPKISAVKVVDPNVNNGPTSTLVINFYSDNALKNKINLGTLYSENNNGVLGGETVNSGVGGYNVKTDVTYYFNTPPAVLEALKENNTYVIYAQASVSGEDSEVRTLEFRRLSLENLY